MAIIKVGTLPRPYMASGYLSLHLLLTLVPSLTIFLTSAGRSLPFSLELSSLVLSDQNLYPPSHWCSPWAADCCSSFRDHMKSQGLRVILSILSLKKAENDSSASHIHSRSLTSGGQGLPCPTLYHVSAAQPSSWHEKGSINSLKGFKKVYEREHTCIRVPNGCLN